MKTVVNGVFYDTSIARPISVNCFSIRGLATEETIYCMPDGHHFIIRRIGGKEKILLPASSEEIIRWKQYHG